MTKACDGQTRGDRRSDTSSDVIWREFDATTAEGYRPDKVTMLFSGGSAGGTGTYLHYHYILDDLQWPNTAALPDSPAVALNNPDNDLAAAFGEFNVFNDSTFDGIALNGRRFMPPYCTGRDTLRSSRYYASGVDAYYNQRVPSSSLGRPTSFPALSEPHCNFIMLASVTQVS